MRTRLVASALAGLAAAGPVLAYCDDPQASMVELKDCLAGVQTSVETELAVVWSAVHRDIAARDFLEPTLRARYAAAADRAQAAWLAWREAECGEVTGHEWHGGSGAGVAIRGCMIETTAARVRDLATRYRIDAADLPVSAAAAE